MLSKPFAASLPSVVDYYWLNRPRARSNLLNEIVIRDTRERRIKGVRRRPRTSAEHSPNMCKTGGGDINSLVFPGLGEKCLGASLFQVFQTFLYIASATK